MHWGVTILPINAIVSQCACNSPSVHAIVSQCACNSLSLHVLYLGPKLVKNIFCYFWLDVKIYRGHPLTLISALGVTILRLNAIVSQRACNSPSLHVLYLGSKIVKFIFYYCIPRTKYVRGILWFSRRYAAASASASASAASASAFHRLRDNFKKPYRIASIFDM